VRWELSLLSVFGVGLSLYARCFYSPSCRQGKFSETSMQPCGSLCVRIGAKGEGAEEFFLIFLSFLIPCEPTGRIRL